MKYYLYNPFANNGIKSHIPEGANLIDASKTDYPEFFAKYQMMNLKNHNVYTSKFNLYVVDLARIEWAMI